MSLHSSIKVLLAILVTSTIAGHDRGNRQETKSNDCLEPWSDNNTFGGSPEIGNDTLFRSMQFNNNQQRELKLYRIAANLSVDFMRNASSYSSNPLNVAVGTVIRIDDVKYNTTIKYFRTSENQFRFSTASQCAKEAYGNLTAVKQLEVKLLEANGNSSTLENERGMIKNQTVALEGEIFNLTKKIQEYEQNASQLAQFAEQMRIKVASQVTAIRQQAQQQPSIQNSSPVNRECFEKRELLNPYEGLTPSQKQGKFLLKNLSDLNVYVSLVSQPDPQLLSSGQKLFVTTTIGSVYVISEDALIQEPIKYLKVTKRRFGFKLKCDSSSQAVSTNSGVDAKVTAKIGQIQFKVWQKQQQVKKIKAGKKLAEQSLKKVKEQLKSSNETLETYVKQVNEAQATVKKIKKELSSLRAAENAKEKKKQRRGKKQVKKGKKEPKKRSFKEDQKPIKDTSLTRFLNWLF